LALIVLWSALFQWLGTQNQLTDEGIIHDISTSGYSQAAERIMFMATAMK
jgi:hypothetical protein